MIMGNEKQNTLKEYLVSRQEITNKALDGYLSKNNRFSATVFESMRYSVFAGGKRLRPILCMASAETVGGDIKTVLPVACALEFIHTYSLIHDDLPVMDDDDYRRGLLTNHKVYGEGIAVLAGDALLTEAFHLMSNRDLLTGIPSETILSVIHEISKASGAEGMVGGQVVDLESEGKNVDMETLNYIHMHKTEALIKVSIRAGALLSGASGKELNALSEYGSAIGLAFQIADDILDIESDLETLGKSTGADGVHQKATFPNLVGLEPSKQRARELIEKALSDIDFFDSKADFLRMIARFIVDRKS
jgi:geranylgeranyl diphosphate synthase type II